MGIDTKRASALEVSLSNPMDVASYNVHEAATYLRIPYGTLRTWVKGTRYRTLQGAESSPPILSIADPAQNLLSFHDLVEAHVLRSLRTHHTVSLQNLRRALRFAESNLRLDRPLLSGQLRTAARDVFIDYVGDIVNLSKGGQLALGRFLDEHLERVAYENDLPVRLYPFVTHGLVWDSRNVAIDPRISFGQPIVAGSGVTTRALSRRFDAGETIESLVFDYDLRQDQVEDAILFEAA